MYLVWRTAWDSVKGVHDSYYIRPNIKDFKDFIRSWYTKQVSLSKAESLQSIFQCFLRVNSYNLYCTCIFEYSSLQLISSCSLEQGHANLDWGLVMKITELNSIQAARFRHKHNDLSLTLRIVFTFHNILVRDSINLHKCLRDRFSSWIRSRFSNFKNFSKFFVG